MVSDLAVGFARQMASAFETDNVEQLAPDQALTAIHLCKFLQSLFADARRSIDSRLAQGVDASTFAGTYGRAVADLETALAATERVVARGRDASLSPQAALFVSSYRDLMDEMLGLRKFLQEAVAKAKLPPRAVDRKRIDAAEAAFDRGQTRPFQRSSKERAGE